MATSSMLKSSNGSSFCVSSLLKVIIVLAAVIFSAENSYVSAKGKASSPEFEKAIALLKKYEGLHKNHGNLIGYGHLVVEGDGYKPGANLSEAQADRLLRKDLRLLCKEYRSLGKDSLLMAVFAYNLGKGGVARSSVYKSLQAGNRNIKNTYLSYCKAKGKIITQLQKRRQEELETLFFD
ncbi:MAG: glycoside hydrolase family protein [Muribaculaceae bacterium]|nr:glycoside hydrolase family protein [Muribaculaceae bacterium]